MRRLFSYVIILVLAVFLGLWLRSDPGYILIAYKKWTIETSLWFGIILFVVVLFIIYQLLRFLRLLFTTHGHLLRWYHERRFLRAHNVTGAGLLALAEGEWEEAEDLLIQAAKSSRISVVNYLYAARAAQECSRDTEREKYLTLALEAAQGYEKIAVFLMKAQLQIDRFDYPSAQKVLEELHERHPRHRYTLKLLQQVYLAQQSWTKLLTVLPLLKKSRVLNTEVYSEIATKTYVGLLLEARDLEALNKLWKDLAKAHKQNPDLILAYAKQLQKYQANDKAIELLGNFLKKNQHAEIENLYCRLK